MEKQYLMVCFSLFVLATLSFFPHTTMAAYRIVNEVPNSPGGRIFEQQIGRDFTLNLMATANEFIWKLFEQYRPIARQNFPLVTLYISEFQGISYTKGPDIHVSASGLEKRNYPSQSSTQFHFTSLMYRELAHVFQFNGNSSAPRGLIEGIADYVMVKSGFYEKEKYTKPGDGRRWDQGFGVTERFLEYCDGFKESFTAMLNNKMRFYTYSDVYFLDLLGKSVDQLWTQYKAKYGKTVDSPDSNITTTD